MERLICVLVGYVFGLIQTGYIYGKKNGVDLEKRGAEMQEQRMHFVPWAGKQERSHCLETALNA
mgnify:FL=1